jgi:protein subunit release factor B
MTRELAFSVTLKDCDVDTFSSGGPGGQNVNRRSTGVRITHRASGAVGKSTEERSQLQNKKRAFRRMAETPVFTTWVRMQSGRDGHLRAEVERSLWPGNVRTEVREGGEWVEK